MNLYREAQLLPRTLRGRNSLATPADLDRYGVSAAATRWRSGRRGIIRVHRGAYLLGACQPDLLDRVRAALLVSPPSAVLGYHTAAALLGFGVAESPDIHLVVPAGGPFPQRPGIVVHQSTIPVGAPARVLGVPCVSAARCAVDLARMLPPPLALSTLDATLATAACTQDDLSTELGLHIGLRGIRQARDLVAIADARAECRQESHLRLILYEGGVRGLVPKVQVSDEYGLVNYHLDLADPARRIGVEYDGGSHLDRNRLRHDRARHHWLESNGWRMRYFTDRDLDERPDDIARIVRAAHLTTR